MNDPSEEKFPQLIEEATVPWWIGIMSGMVDIFGKHPYIFIAIFVPFVFFLKWIGEIK
ncbi:hypothetical protein [Methanochimaera problematica]|uniref:hypothetical protein n=1 Tax=Methanochimaera problematica TaxID=2609417 RepID=UPI00293940DC|nr:hypothetical protein [Methanoplanus sp. FWC-SCC4]